MRPRDVQRAKVYRWERALPVSHALMLAADVDALVAQIHADYGKPMPTITRKGKGTFHMPGIGRLNFAPWGHRRWIVVHECAHALLTDSWRAEAAHGPRFMRLYIELLHRYVGLPIAETMLSAHGAGIRVASLRAVPQPIDSPAIFIQAPITHTGEQLAFAI